ncbi:MULTISPECIES: 2TM domain-containing protein [Aneurinibacillus]|uniref:2TM domain-containing protein n=1 Tax=Aneurinibacillus thermoaerophilus TaxID=143495 RepID=A0A1G7Y590_ANETH|nr:MULTISPECIES: 2TM domain-containing protein [Aneurinibacillus]AMA72868.1 histidine kinase [Aneurinibacillus sp. XH2]MED0676597.1 2TM domain-containing protein [Aneurinibacillus thermoaerophilus]MED0680043.1 2TM domain-containing protein [Aneurinibacillus thermoaerophilus]MED0737612.1 2TM domain-containing protein [Aneurinibacillus thermoaerophilus]MED0758184.1 2TM domain-containing protein [Aneurinibacillus thermoaerophilus]
MEKNEKYLRAKKRVKALKGFYIHLVVFILVNIGLFFIDLLFSRDSTWFYFPLFGWGIGLLAHGITVLGFGGLFGSEWEKKKIQEFMDKE